MQYKVKQRVGLLYTWRISHSEAFSMKNCIPKHIYFARCLYMPHIHIHLSHMTNIWSQAVSYRKLSSAQKMLGTICTYWTKANKNCTGVLLHSYHQLQRRWMRISRWTGPPFLLWPYETHYLFEPIKMQHASCWALPNWKAFIHHQSILWLGDPILGNS